MRGEHAALELLRAYDSDRRVHSGRSALDHLTGTSRILRSWGMDDDVCIAGLCHNLYGTRTFDAAAVIGDRRRVCEALGTRAERLVYLFCVIRHRALFDGKVPAALPTRHGDSETIDENEYRAMLHLVLANTLEQFPARWWVGRAVLTLQAPLWTAVETRIDRTALEHWRREAAALHRHRITALALVCFWQVLCRFGFSNRPID